MNSPRRLAILAAFSGQGGVEKMVLNLLEGFAPYDVEVDLLAIVRKQYRWPEIRNSRVRVISFKSRHSSLALPEVIGYLRAQRPDVLLAVRDRAIRTAALACRLAGSDVPLFGNLHSLLGESLAAKNALQRWWRLWPMKALYRRIDGIIAISEGVAEDIAAVAGVPLDRIKVVRNPVVDARMLAASKDPVAHRWLGDGGGPVVIGAGRLSAEKDFATLIRAFGRLRECLNARLVILGEGRQRPKLERLVADLGLSDCVDLPGYTDNPYPTMAAADLFVLSSLREGSGNVLTEALALGTPVVATDCPTGPREMLQGGRYGALVPVGDAESLAGAMLQTLGNPPPPAFLREAVGEYHVEHSARAYLQALNLLPSNSY